MRETAIFFKKEVLESWRTKRFLILGVVFLIFAIMSPLFAKLTPEIMKTALGQTMADQIPTPTSLDSWTQYYKNISQLGIFVIVIMFSGSLSGEVAKGTLVNLVTKGLPRYAVILGKFLNQFLEWTILLGASFLITWGYTAYYFPDHASPHIFLGFVPLFVFGFFLLSVILFGSAIARNNYTGLLLAVFVYAGLNVVNLFKKAVDYNPITLINKNVAIIQSKSVFGQISPALWISLAAGVFLIFLAIRIFDKKKL